MTISLLTPRAPSRELLSREPTPTLPEATLLATERRPARRPPRPGDSPRLTEAELFAAYSIGVREGWR